MEPVFETLLEYVKVANIQYKHVEHEPTFTSEESAKARNEPLEVGAKAVVMKVDDAFVIFVLSASKKLDSKKIKKAMKASSLRFATKEELFSYTGLVPGSVPPFGKPILPFELFIDESIKDLPKVAFNAGSLSNSMILKTEDYLNLSKGVVGSYTLPALN